MRILSLFFLTVLMISIVSANYGASVQLNVNTNNNNQSENNSNGIGIQLNGDIAEKRTEYRSGNFTTSLGQYLSVKETVEGLLELRENNVTVETKLNLTKVEGNESKLEVELSNGNKAEIKIMPSTASETALARLGVNQCNESDNCTIELKEVGNENNNSTVEYDVQLNKDSKILGIFDKKMSVSAEVDAQTGAVIGEHRPWWAFLAVESSSSANVSTP